MTDLIANILGPIMKWCYNIVSDYGLSIIFFTLITKIILFPLSLVVQKNSIKMVKMKPELDSLKSRYADDKEKFMDEQIDLYKREHYSPMLGVIPLLIQIPIILGLIGVIYNPLQHILTIDTATTESFTQHSMELLQLDEEPSGFQLQILGLIKNPAYYDNFAAIDAQAADTAKNFNTFFCGMDLSVTPSFSGGFGTFTSAIIAILSTALLCWFQNRINVLQIEQSKLQNFGMSAFTVAFTAWFALVVPAGVSLYWTAGNIFGIAVMYLCNIVYKPSKYIDYDTLNKMKSDAAEKEKMRRENSAREKKDYRKFFSVDKMQLMFYSEQSGFYKYYSDIIDDILSRSDDITIHYVTSDPKDKIFETENPRIVPYYIGSDAKLISLFMKIEADIVVMTMPDLHNFHIKRSIVRDDVEYIYTEHGATSLNLTYREGSFDNYDTIFVIGDNEVEEVRAIEKLHGTKRKRIVRTGYCLIDNMIRSYNASEKIPNEKKTIVIGPSWQKDNIMDLCLENLIENIKGDYRIIVRPHPQYIRHNKAVLDELESKLSVDTRVEFEKDFSSNSSVYSADLLITDWSTIAHEFAFTTKKPVIFIDTPMKISNKEYDKIDVESFDIASRNLIGISISPDNLNEVSSAVDELINNGEKYAEKLERLTREHFCNLGHCGEIAGKYIVDRLHGIEIKEDENIIF